MEKPGTINVVGEDKALEISRAIIRTHEYVLQNVAVLNDRERGYMFNEYFPAVKDYLIIEPDVLVPAKPEDLKVFIGDSVGKNYPHPDELEVFEYGKNTQLLSVSLSYIPEAIKSVRIAKNQESYDMGRSYQMIFTQEWIVTITTGLVSFLEFFAKENRDNLNSIFNDCDIEDDFCLFIKYIPKRPFTASEYRKQAKPYEVGTDGEN